MQKTLFIKLSIIAGLCVIFAIGLTMFSAVITERQYYADSVVSEIAQQHVNPQEVITPFIAVPTTITPNCAMETTDKSSKCRAPYSSVETLFATQTMADQNLVVSTDTYQRGVYHATSYEGSLSFDQNYALDNYANDDAANNIDDNHANSVVVSSDSQVAKKVINWTQAKLIIAVSDLRGVAVLPTVTIDGIAIKATYPQTAMLQGLSYVEVTLPQSVQAKLQSAASTLQKPTVQTADISDNSANTNDMTNIIVDLGLAGVSNLSTVPTGQNFEMTMRSNWHAPNFIGKALPNAKNLSSKSFEAQWQNQYLTIANTQYLSQCLLISNNQCTVISEASLEISNDSYDPEIAMVANASTDNGSMEGPVLSSINLNSFGVSFAEPNDVYLQTERTMKYALLLILVSFGTFFLFEVIKSSRIHPIQYLLVGCALLTFYVLLLPLAEQIVFWQAYAIAASACVGLIGWYTYYVLGSVKRALIFTATLAGLYAAFYSILTTEDMNLLFGAVFCFALLACVMVMTRKIDWYKVA